MRGIPSRRRLARLAGAAILAAALVALGATGATARDRGHSGGNDHGHKGGHDHGGNSALGAIYTETNDAAGNAVLVFARHRDGTIVQTASVPTGGLGLAMNPPFGFPIVDSQAAVALSEDGRLLFAVNAGDNTVTVFGVTKHGLRKVDQVASGGTEPISVTSNGTWSTYSTRTAATSPGSRSRDTTGSARSRGRRSRSRLRAPAGSRRRSASRRTAACLTVTERCYLGGCANQPKGVLDTFVVDRHGRAGPAQGERVG